MSKAQQRTQSRQTYYKDFRFKMVILFVVLSLAPMVLITGIILHQFNQFSNTMVHAHLDELVLKHRQKIDAFLKQKLNDICHLSKAYDFTLLQDRDFLLQRLRALQEDYGFQFVDLGVIDQEGRQVAYAGPFNLHQADYSEAHWFKKAVEQDIYISDVFLGIRGQPHFIVTARRTWNGRQFLLRGTIDFFAFNTLVDDFVVGKTGTAFILNRHGEFQTRPPIGELQLTRQQYINLFNMGENAHHNRNTPGIIHATPIRKLPAEVRNQSGDQNAAAFSYGTFTVNKTGVDDTHFIIVAAFLKNNDWLLIFQQETKDAFAQLKQTRHLSMVILFIGAMAIIAMAFFVSGRLMKRILSLDSEKESMNQQIVETGKLASIGELAAGIAHEINNPVAVMIEEAGWIQDLLAEGLDKGNNFDELKRALQQIETQGHRCKGITHKLLSFARKTDSRMETLQINDFVTEVLDLLAQTFRYANIRIEVSPQRDLPAIEASATEIQQVLMNIIQNAVHAMEKTGGSLFIGTRSDGDFIYISIKDTGPGIRPSDLGRIFDPFFTTKPVGKGTGLGLSICYGIIHKMGGRIDVNSQPGDGTTFTIVLPLNTQAAVS